MDTNKLERFAQESRRKLLSIVESRLEYVLSSDSAEFREKKDQVERIKKKITEKSKDTLIEEVAYTWFNRFIALRFIDANNYSDIRAVTPTPGHTQPEILEVFKAGHCPENIPVESDKLYRILDGKIPTREPQNEVYRHLLLGVCNSWYEKMPFMFEKLRDYAELLMPEDLLSEHSILANINENITDEDCQDVEVIGWLYQFYISEKKDEVIGAKQKIKTEDIPAATQLFTPHWIVRYLVENSLGRLWMLNHPHSSLASQMEYYITPKEMETDFLKISNPEEIRICDPACGSGHMLTYAFDLLTRIYEEEGYDKPDIAKLILEKNLYGIEIDQRAASLAAFALTMKAREYDRRFFRRETLKPNIMCLEKVSFSEEELKTYKNAIGEELYTQNLEDTLFMFDLADNAGSLISPSLTNPDYYIKKLEDMDFCQSWELSITNEKVLSVLRQVEYLAGKYHCVVANPPYMGNRNINDKLKAFAKKNYPDSKSDLFAMFIERNLSFVYRTGYVGLMTPFNWMFLSSFEKLRHRLLSETTICSLIKPEFHAFFESAYVSVCTFCLYCGVTENNGTFIDLSNFYGAHLQSLKVLEAISNPNCKWLYRASASNFKKIPGSPIAYWVSSKQRQIFGDNVSLSPVCKPTQGLATGDNDTFIRNWHEVSVANIGFSYENRQEAAQSGKKWFPYNKGGDFRRWYGNQIFVLNWKNDGSEIRNFKNKSGQLRSRPQNMNTYFQESVSWSKISCGYPAFRFFPLGFIYDVAGTSIFCDEPDIQIKILGYCNSLVAQKFLEVLSPTLNFEVGHIASLPIKPNIGKTNIIKELIDISKSDWNSYETSWDFTSLLLLQSDYLYPSLETTYANLRKHWQDMTQEMKHLEEENNRIFIEAYGLEDELTPEVPVEEITLTCNPHYRYSNNKSDDELEGLLLADTMREFISYAVGCMFGRYSLDKPGLILANQGETLEDYINKVGVPKEEIKYLPDEDNVLPITEGEYFEDDIVTKFKKFLRVTFGDECYEENLAFIENAIGKDIRKYFLMDFYKHHVRMYKKRPIYWLFSSENKSFNTLIYMHRYRPDTVSTVLNEYLRQFIRKLEAQKGNLARWAEDSPLSVREKGQIQKEIEDINKMLRELSDYEMQILYPLAAQRTEIDLDDGVKVNYAKFGKALAVI